MNIKTILATGLLLGTAIFGAKSANADVITHKVVEGDTLSSISQEYLGSASFVQNIASNNGIQNANLIYVGQELKFDTDNMTMTLVEPASHVEEVVALETPAPAPVVETAPAVSYSAPAQVTTTNTSSAKEWIAQKESGGSYTATNGQYIGRYQLSASYLNGDYSAANQERVADQYVTSRYGSWDAAKAFWLANGWY
ncbi:LysM peptidoglycan-binding domain-containing protein [Streptococcaceae bacterium ESL0729]|nr:LysM peptidoglycan-binding domain-containing protein [Streptococcaceae bacterium ESL0729]